MNNSKSYSFLHESFATSSVLSSQADAVLAAEEKEWEAEMKLVEEVDRWEKLGEEKIPEDLSSSIFGIINQFSSLKRLPILKLMGNLRWEYESLRQYSIVLNKIPCDMIHELLDLIESTLPTLIPLPRFLLILYKLKDHQIIEMVRQNTKKDIHMFLQVIRHINMEEIEILINLIDQLNIQTIIDILYRCNEPKAKNCLLCKTKKSRALGLRLNNKQMPDNVLPTISMLPTVEKFDSWSADDEKFYSFNVETAEIFWFEAKVDLLQICDNCLLQVNQALTNNGRFKEFYHINPAERIKSYQNQRQEEQNMAIIVRKISIERLHRRVREFSLRALHEQRKGLKREENDLLKNREKYKELLEFKKEHEKQENLIKRAMINDEKQQESNKLLLEKRMEYRKNVTSIQQHLGFNMEDRLPLKERLHPLTWRLGHFDKEGNPISSEGATMMFGKYTPQEYNELEDMKKWKEIAKQKSDEHEKKIAEINALDRQKQLEKIHVLRKYVDERTMTHQWRIEKLEGIAKRQEEKRLKKREDDRINRRNLRFLEYLKHEQMEMENEDHRSYLSRAYLWECDQIRREREEMFNAECEQKEIDNFWGFDTYERKLNEEEARLRKLYEEKVYKANLELVKLKVIKPFKKPSLTKVGTLREDILYDREVQRREQVVKKLKAEEVRGKLKTRLYPGYLEGF